MRLVRRASLRQISEVVRWGNGAECSDSTNHTTRFPKNPYRRIRAKQEGAPDQRPRSAFPFRLAISLAVSLAVKLRGSQNVNDFRVKAFCATFVYHERGYKRV